MLNLNDPNTLPYLLQQLKKMFVAAEAGKGLSSNDYTDEDKQKLDNMGGGSSWETLFPIGTVLIRYDHKSPAELYGGTWARLTQRFLYAGNENETIGTTGGEASHKLTVSEMPSHKHNIIWNNDTQLVVSLSGSKASESTATESQQGYRTSYTSGAVYSDSYITAPVGGNAAHNNMPPYVTVSVWRRTA